MRQVGQDIGSGVQGKASDVNDWLFLQMPVMFVSTTESP